MTQKPDKCPVCGRFDWAESIMGSITAAETALAFVGIESLDWGSRIERVVAEYQCRLSAAERERDEARKALLNCLDRESKLDAYILAWREAWDRQCAGEKLIPDLPEEKALYDAANALVSEDPKAVVDLPETKLEEMARETIEAADRDIKTRKDALAVCKWVSESDTIDAYMPALADAARRVLGGGASAERAHAEKEPKA